MKESEIMTRKELESELDYVKRKIRRLEEELIKAENEEYELKKQLNGLGDQG